MPRTKKAAKRGNFQGAVRGGRRNLETSFVPFDGTSALRSGLDGFTLQEEARNTERHSFWSTDQRLRHTKVNFVSAGSLESTKPDDTEAALAGMSLESPKCEHEKVLVVEEEAALLEEQAPSCSVKPSEDEQLPSFVIDTYGSQTIHTGIPPPKLRPISPTPSNSSEEIILFRGRDQQGRGLSNPPQRPRVQTDPIDAKIRIVEDRIHEQQELLEDVLRHAKPSPSPLPPSFTESFAAELEPTLPKQRRRATRRDRHNNKRAEKSEEDVLIADYIANIDSDDGSVFESFQQRDLGGTEEELWQDTEASSGDPAAHSKRHAFQSGWDRSDICDLDELSTSDGVMGDLQAILSKRDRVSGTQYLVVWEDQTIDEARWVPATTLTSVSAMSHIENFEAEEKLVAEFMDNEVDDTCDSDDAETDDGAEEDDNDEDDLVQKKISRMSDEKIARLLAKQEELGMGSHEILLFDEDDDDDDDDEDIGFSKTTSSRIMVSSRNSRPRDHGSRRPRGDVPSATILADAYDGFDVMDFDRPSLKKRPKGRRGKPIFDISDSELEASMQMAWENDRAKKKERKEDRQSLRAQGMLGSKNGKVDLKQKYREGMGIHSVKEEIKTFLMGGNTTLALPPMDKADRKIVHELANAFNLKSKSAGTGTKRFPILYRTSRTLALVEGTFDAVEARLSRRFLPRMNVSGKRTSTGIKRAGRGGGFNSAAVSYRDGDIVGGSAPELGAENRGRAMLEKMGWSSGTALGALNNKGILQPVSHVVKTTKAGLG